MAPAIEGPTSAMTGIHSQLGWLLFFGLLFMAPRLFYLQRKNRPFTLWDRIGIGVLALAYFNIVLTGVYLTLGLTIITRTMHVVLGSVPILGVLIVLLVVGGSRIPLSPWRIQRLLQALFVVGAVFVVLARWMSIGETAAFGMIYWPFPELFPVWLLPPPN